MAVSSSPSHALQDDGGSARQFGYQFPHRIVFVNCRRAHLFRSSVIFPASSIIDIKKSIKSLTEVFEWVMWVEMSLVEKESITTAEELLERIRVQNCILERLTSELAQEKKWKIEDPRMLREQIRVADVAYNSLHERYQSLSARVAGLEKDKARLDWLETWDRSHNLNLYTRSAIDSAMKQAQ